MRVRLCRFMVGLAIVGFAGEAAAQAPPPRLEVLTRQGDYYWVVTYDADGTRRGGWVSAQLIDGIDTRAFRPVPAAPPPAPAAVPLVSVPNDYDGIVLALQRMRDRLTTAATTLDGFPDGAALRNRAAQIDQAIANVRQLATDQSFGSRTSAPTAPLSASAPPPPPPPPPSFTQQPPFERPAPPVATTGRPQIRRGWWFNGGLGIGSAGCNDCIGRETGGTADFSVGKAVGERWALGVGTAGFAVETIFGTVGVSTLDFRARFYPSIPHGFFITGGLGFGGFSVEDEIEVGAGALFGVGWDIRVGRNVSITPMYTGFAMASDFVDANVGQLGISVTIH